MTPEERSNAEAMAKELASASLCRTFASTTVEHAGKKYEVRTPNLETWDAVQHGGLSASKADVVLAVRCTFVPGTDVRVFPPDAEERLMKLPADPGGLVYRLALAAVKLVVSVQSEARGKSEATASSGSGSPSPGTSD